MTAQRGFPCNHDQRSRHAIDKDVATVARDITVRRPFRASRHTATLFQTNPTRTRGEFVVVSRLRDPTELGDCRISRLTASRRRARELKSLFRRDAHACGLRLIDRIATNPTIPKLGEAGEYRMLRASIALLFVSLLQLERRHQ